MHKTKDPSHTIAGLLITVAAVELVFFVLLAQHFYPNYSLKNNYISDLGVGSTAHIFNPAIIFFGIVLLGSSYFVRRTGHRLAALAFLLIGIGGIGVGTFPETTGLPHIISALVTFGMVGVAALGFSRIFKGKLAYYSGVAGIFALLILVIFGFNLAGAHLSTGLGKGGIEELLFYDELVWASVVGVSFILKRI